MSVEKNNSPSIALDPIAIVVAAVVFVVLMSYKAFAWVFMQVFLNIKKACFDAKKKDAKASVARKFCNVMPEAGRLISELGNTHFEVAQAHRSAIFGDFTVHFRLYDGRITRVLKELCKLPHHRSPLGGHSRKIMPDFTPDKAESAGINFDMEGAILFTEKELSGFIKNVSKAKSTKTKAGGETAPEKFDAASSAFEVDHASEDTEVNSTRVSQEATGIVIEAATKEVRPEGRKAYKTFSVVLRTNSGEAIFSGNDLERKFEERLFKVGDHLNIIKRSSTFETEVKGKMQKRSKNEFTIKLIRP